MADGQKRAVREPKPARLVRTDMECTECLKHFIAQLDLSLDGNHIIECPWCGHEHCRVVEHGKVTEDRWSSRVGKRINVDRRCVWKADSRPIITSTAAAFIRDSWLNRLDLDLSR